MPLRRSTLVAAVCLVACGGSEPAPVAPPPPPPIASAPPAPPAPPTVPGHSIDLDAMDRSVAPGDDFFAYADGGWFKATEIPADRTNAGVGQKLTEEVEKRTSELLDEASRSSAPDLAKIGDFYAAFLDEAGIEAHGMKPLGPVL
ncbi:MAG TPA: hypothetical protein VIY73_25495, partial [Polyangiaceae bacterium]